MSSLQSRPPRPDGSGWRLAALTSALLLAFAGPAVATSEKSAKYFEDAQLRYRNNDFVGSTVQLKNALKEDNKNLAAHLLLGKVLQQAGELKAAEAAYETALKQGVSKVEVAPLLGQVYLQLGNTRQLLETITPTGLPVAGQVEVLTLRGSAMAMGGNFAAATQAFTEARALDPKSALPNIAEAAVLMRQGDPEKARAMAVKGTEMAPGSPGAWYQLGTIQFHLGDAAAALSSFDKALAANGKHVDSRVSRASVLMSLKRVDEARAELQTLKEGKVVEPRASFLRAVIASNRGEAAAAKASYVEAANLIDALSPNVRSGSEALLMAGALSHRELGNKEKSREYLETLLGRNSKHLTAQTLLAATLMEAGELNRAVPLLEGLLRNNPNDSQALYMMGSLYMARRQYAQAAEFLDKAAKLTSGGPALRDLSFSQLGLGQEKLGLANLEKAYKQNPKDMRAGIELAVYYARAGDAKRAVKIAEDLVALDPENLTMLNFLGNIKGRLGDRQGLKQAYERVLAKDPKFRQVVMNMAWFEMSEKQYDPARARLKAYLKDSPKDPDVLFQLGLLEQTTRRPAEAATYWTQAMDLPQSDPRAGLSLVDLHLQERQADKALAIAKVMAGRFADLPQAHMALARTYLAKNEAALAQAALQDAGTKAGFDPEQLVQVGRLQMQLGNLAGASYAANKALQTNPADALALGLLVEIAGRKGNAADIDKALAALQAKHPNHPLTLTTAGHIAFSRNQVPKALGLYKQVFDREPNTMLALAMAQAFVANKEPAKAVALLEGWSKKQPEDRTAARALADIQLFAGRNNEARQTYEALVKANPNDAILLAAYGRALSQLNDPAAAATMEKAYKLAPANSGIAQAYGATLLQRGDANGAVRVLREARLREPGNTGLRVQLASALAKAGSKGEAAEELKAALGSAPPPAKTPELDQLRRELGV
jgi:putative PEP-CTERM system TPR-repeat lipoprotein